MSEGGGFADRLQAARGGLFDGETRYLLLRADTLAGLFERLAPAAQRAALDAFAEAVREYGGRSVARYAAAAGAGTAELLALLAETAPQLGWGEWRFTGTDTATLALRVDNSPFTVLAPAVAGPRCAPIAGMFGAIASQCAGRALRGEEWRCAGEGAAACEFRVQAAG